MNGIPQKTNPQFLTCSVVMAVYKNDLAEWFDVALKSILGQTLKSDDIVIVRDGVVSLGIEKILEDYEAMSNITVVRLEKNVGAGEARNIGLRLAKNALVAIMDADDIAVPNRFELQLAEFNKNPELTIVGGQIAEFEGNPENVVSYRNVPMNQTEIVEFSKRRSPFNNMCVCVAKKHVLAVGGYQKITRAEDYNLWLKLLSDGMLSSNLPEVLCYVRTDDASLGRRITIEQTTELLKLRYKYFRLRYIGLMDLAVAGIANIALLVIPKRITKMIYKKALRT